MGAQRVLEDLEGAGVHHEIERRDSLSEMGDEDGERVDDPNGVPTGNASRSQNKDFTEDDQRVISGHFQSIWNPNFLEVPPPRDTKRKRLAQHDKAFKAMTDIKENTANCDEYTIFGELVANNLRKCSSSPRDDAIAQHRISDILFNLEVGSYRSHVLPRGGGQLGGQGGYTCSSSPSRSTPSPRPAQTSRHQTPMPNMSNCSNKGIV